MTLSFLPRITFTRPIFKIAVGYGHFEHSHMYVYVYYSQAHLTCKNETKENIYKPYPTDPSIHPSIKIKHVT